MRSKNWKNIVVILCIIIIIAYTSIVFLPHVHDCVGPDCTVCALIETSRNTLIGLALIAVVYQLPNIVFTILSSYKSIPSGNKGTPVALKVKLSD
jgi:Ca2+/Na+ antiporter